MAASLSLAALARPGDTVYVEIADHPGSSWSYPSRVVWTAGGRLALTLPAEARWWSLLSPGRGLVVTLSAGEAAATEEMVVEGVSRELPPLLLVGSRVAAGPGIGLLPGWMPVA